MPHWRFSDEHEMFRKSVRRFVEKELSPFVEEWEEAGEVPEMVFRRAGENGYLGLKYPEEFGGAADYPAAAIFHEELGRCGAGGVAAALRAHAEMATPLINFLGTGEQKERYLAPAVQGQKIAAPGIADFEGGVDWGSGSGSDLGLGLDGPALLPAAVREGAHYVVNGRILAINGASCDFVVLAVKDPAAGVGNGIEKNREAGLRGISLLLVDKGTPGFAVGERRPMLGWRSSGTAELSFEDCRVPAENLLGEEKMGFQHITANRRWEWITLALGAVGGAGMALETAQKYASQRVQFGRPLTGFQATRHKLAEMAAGIEAARELAYHALDLYVNDVEGAGGFDATVVAGGMGRVDPPVPTKEAAMAKLYATEVYRWVADNAVQIHGGYGYAMEYPAQRFWRDARLGTIKEGASEFMREAIAEEILK
ncbi:MAG: acyl-CoA dehydrogenase family protein [Firmicutes bacterium]|nr:acyl-CoA dehydrogenase family protein [Bacillota bacterium]